MKKEIKTITLGGFIGASIIAGTALNVLEAFVIKPVAKKVANAIWNKEKSSLDYETGDQILKDLEEEEFEEDEESSEETEEE